MVWNVEFCNLVFFFFSPHTTPGLCFPRFGNLVVCRILQGLLRLMVSLYEGSTRHMSLQHPPRWTQLVLMLKNLMINILRKKRRRNRRRKREIFLRRKRRYFFSYCIWCWVDDNFLVGFYFLFCLFIF